MIPEAVLVWLGIAAAVVVALLLLLAYMAARAIRREVARARRAVLEIEAHTNPLRALAVTNQVGASLAALTHSVRLHTEDLAQALTDHSTAKKEVQ